MRPDDTVIWLPTSLVLTALLAVATWLVWRARGPRPGVRLLGLTLLPLALYLTGLLRLVWMMFWQISAWASGFVLRPSTWVGMVLGLVGLGLAVGAGRLPSGRARDHQPPASRRRSKDPDDLDEIEALLRKHGIE